MNSMISSWGHTAVRLCALCVLHAGVGGDGSWCARQDLCMRPAVRMLESSSKQQHQVVQVGERVARVDLHNSPPQQHITVSN